MQELDNLMLAHASAPTDSAISARLAAEVSAWTGFPADALLDSGDPTGFRMAQRIVSDAGLIAGRVRGWAKRHAGMPDTVDCLVRVSVGISLPVCDTKPGVDLRAEAGERGRKYRRVLGRRYGPAQVPCRTVTVGHLAVLRAAMSTNYVRVVLNRKT